MWQNGFQVIKDNSNILSTTIYRNGFNWHASDYIRTYYVTNQYINYDSSNFSLIELWDRFQQPHFYGELQSGKNIIDAKYRLQIRDPGHFFGKGHFVVSKNSSGPWIIAGTYTNPYLDIFHTINEYAEPYYSSWAPLTLISGLIKIEDKPIYNKKNLEEIHLTIDLQIQQII